MSERARESYLTAIAFVREQLVQMLQCAEERENREAMADFQGLLAKLELAEQEAREMPDSRENSIQMMISARKLLRWFA